jgi:hypothetical protein
MIPGFSEDVLARFVQDQVQKGGWNRVSDYGRLTCATYATASIAIFQALGPTWTEKHIGRSEKASPYFQADRHDRGELLRYMSRVTELGELILNLHGVGGFDERINSIRTDEKSGIESGIAELIAGRLFKVAGVFFQYVVAPRQAHGNTPTNPDIEYVAGANRVEVCEVKCNLQSTDLAEEPIRNILKKAKSQLPKGKAGMILLRVPENWFTDTTATTVVERAVTGFIEKERTTRVSSVYIFVSETRLLPKERMARAFLVREFQNKHCGLRSGIDLHRLTDDSDRWCYLQDWVTRVSGITE